MAEALQLLVLCLQLRTQLMGKYPILCVCVHCVLPVSVSLSLQRNDSKWFEPRCISCLSCVVVQVRVIFRKTVFFVTVVLTT